MILFWILKFDIFLMASSAAAWLENSMTPAPENEKIWRRLNATVPKVHSANR
jgi:hypothetical protein